MNLTQVAQRFKKYLPLITIFGVAFFLIIFTIIARSRPKEETLPVVPIPGYSASTQPASYDLSRLKPVEVPDELAIYKLTPQPLTRDFAFSLASKLNFEPQPTQIIEETTTGTLYLWADSNRSLNVTEQSAIYDIALPAEGESKTVNVAEAERVAREFLSSINVDPSSLSVNGSYTKYFRIDEATIFPENNIQNADIVQLAFQASVEGNPLVGSNLDLGQATVQVDENNNVVFFQFQKLQQFVPQSKEKIKSFNDALMELNSRRATIIEAVAKTENGTEDIRVQPGFKIESASITNAFLAYYYPTPAPEFIQPIYVFEGEFQSESKENGRLILYLPALEGQVISR
ncbi:MAG TPA: hypothetical protein VIK81_01280 [Patescibacteria group bacterium]